ncbi:MAG: ABC transporter permease [Candidatus Sulfotelmatobacter sp.]
MRRVLAQTRKELTQILRDPLALALALVLPCFLLFLMGTSIALKVEGLPMIVQDFDDSTASHDFVALFRNSLSFHVVSWPVDQRPGEAFLHNHARAALVIPERFGRDLSRGVNTQVQMLIDASDSNTATLISGDTSQVVRAYNALHAGATRGSPVEPEIRLWYNPGLSSKKYAGPGVFVLAVSMFAPLLASLAMAKEGENNTILQVYVSSISAHEFLLGKIFAFMIVGLCECVPLIIMLFTYFGLGFAGDPTPFLTATVLYCFCVSAFGTLIGGVIPSQAAAMQAVALGGFLLVFLLSGLIFPIDNIPPQLRWISNFIWGKYYIYVVRDALLQGGGWPSAWSSVLAIGVIGMVFYLLAWRNMRRMQVKA